MRASPFQTHSIETARYALLAFKCYQREKVIVVFTEHSLRRSYGMTGPVELGLHTMP